MMLVTSSQRVIAIFIILSVLWLFQRFVQLQRGPQSPTHDFAISAHHQSDVDRTLLDVSKPAPRIRQITFLDTDGSPSMLALQERAVETHRRHGQRWGYSMDVARKSDMGPDLDTTLSKAVYLQSVLTAEMSKKVEKRAEWILWFDPQTLLLNPAIPLSIFLPPSDFSTIYALGTKDWAGFNTGVFFLRVHPWTLQMLNDTVIFNSDDRASGAFGGSNNFIWGFESPDYYEHTLYQPREWYNAIRESDPFDDKTSPGHHGGDKKNMGLKPGSMLIHAINTENARNSRYYDFASDEDKSSENSAEILRDHIEQFEDSPKRFEVALSSTSYISEIHEYWARARSTRALLENASAQLYRGDTDDWDVGDLRRAEAELYQTFWEYGYLKEGINSQTDKLNKILQEL